MSKLIVEMPMPRACRWAEEEKTKRCPIAEWGGECAVTKLFEPFDDKRPSWCPIVGVLPEQHGDLIDRDELLKRKGNCYDADGHLLYAVGTGEILQIKPIIAAERKDDEQIH